MAADDISGKIVGEKESCIESQLAFRPIGNGNHDNFHTNELEKLFSMSILRQKGPQEETAVPSSPGGSTARRVHLGVLIVLQLVMAGELVLLLTEQLWLSAFLVSAIMLITLAPILLGARMPVQIPAEFQVLVVIFVFAALFLGEVRGFYARIWWWDVALHTCSGLLLGILGFLMIYVLNENDRVDIHMRPRFVALFAFLFAVSVGALWEIFEFMMDRLIGTTMQKPMFDDPSGLTDTMWDLIVDTIGAFAISALGWWYMKRNVRSFIEVWIRRFIDRNPRLFHPKLRL